VADEHEPEHSAHQKCRGVDHAAGLARDRSSIPATRHDVVPR